MGALVVVKTAHIIAHPIFRYKQKNKKKSVGGEWTPTHLSLPKQQSAIKPW